MVNGRRRVSAALQTESGAVLHAGVVAGFPCVVTGRIWSNAVLYNVGRVVRDVRNRNLYSVLLVWDTIQRSCNMQCGRVHQPLGAISRSPLAHYWPLYAFPCAPCAFKAPHHQALLAALQPSSVTEYSNTARVYPPCALPDRSREHALIQMVIFPNKQMPANPRVYTPDR